VPVKRCPFQIKAVLDGTALDGRIFTEVGIFRCDESRHPARRNASENVDG
jgi:hypothetical protein